MLNDWYPKKVQCIPDSITLFATLFNTFKCMKILSCPGDDYISIYWQTHIIAFEPRTSTYLSVVQWKVGTFANSEPVEFDHKTKARWRFRKILWPSQNI